MKPEESSIWGNFKKLKRKSKRRPTWMESYNQSYAFGALKENHYCLLINAGRGFHDYWVLVDVPGGIVRIKPDEKSGIKKVSPLVRRQAEKMVNEYIGYRAKKILDDSLKGRK